MSYKVSVLVSVYNVEHYIERCARSLFEQTYSNLEYVFVDDCSTDNSVIELERILKDYPEKEKSVRIIHHEKNRGLAAVRNTAFDNATGEFICVVDADDWMETDGIERLVNEQIATNADVVWGKALMHTDKGEIELSEPKYKDINEWRMCYFRFTQDLVMVNWRRIIRRDLLEKHNIRHEEGLHIGNDKQLMPLIAYYADSFSSIDSIVYHYERRNPNARTYKTAQGNYENFAYTREIESMSRVVRFIEDKDTFYYDTAQSAKLERLLQYRKDALCHSSREGFQTMMKWIMETPPKYLEQYGWNIGSIKTKLKSNYTISRLWLLTKMKLHKIVNN